MDSEDYLDDEEEDGSNEALMEGLALIASRINTPAPVVNVPVTVQQPVKPKSMHVQGTYAGYEVDLTITFK
jgi:hypothetical protein